MDIQRIDGYSDSRFSPEVLYQHGAFLVDGEPWSFRIVSGHKAVISGKELTPAAVEEAVELFRFYAEHITSFYDEGGNCLLDLPPVARREVDIDVLQPSQFSVDREKCAAVGHFLRAAADVVIPTITLLDGTLCAIDGHTRLYEAWRRGIRTAMVFESAMPPAQRAVMEDFVREARRRKIFHIRDMALYSAGEQAKEWHAWCDAYFAARREAEAAEGRSGK